MDGENGCNMQFRAKYGSHLPVLVKLLYITDGPVLELGSGWCSTPVMHWLCVPKKRLLVTYENDPGMHRIVHQYNDEYHHVLLIDDWDNADIERQWDIAFIDHAPSERRKVDIARLSNFAKYVVVHDTSWKVEKHYQYSQIWGLFKYRYDYTDAKPYTTILSNYNDLKDISI